MKKCLYIALLLLLSLTLVNTAYAEKEPYGEIRVPVANLALDSFDQASGIETVFYFYLSDSFVAFNEDLSIKPEVARKYKVSRDGLTWTFYLRKGIKFHNGDELTSADAKWTFDRFAACRNAWAANVRKEMASTEIIDNYTFKYTLKKPQPFVIYPIQWMRLYPKKYFEKVGVDEFNKNPIGSGPWKYVSKTPGKQIVFEANENHWQDVPHFKTLTFINVPEESTRIAMFKRGDVDFCGGITYDTAKKLQKDGVRLKSSFFPTMQNVNISGTWLTESPVKDIRIRKAMSYAINRQEMADTYFKGFAEPAAPGFMAGPASFGWKKSWKPDPYDPELAKKLIKEAGYPEKFKDPYVTIFSVQGLGPTHTDQMLMLQDYWQAVGLKVKIESVDTSAFFGYIMKRAEKPSDPIVGKVWQFSLATVSFNGYHLHNLYSNGLHSTMNDPKADKMFDKMMTETNMKKAKNYYQEFVDYGNSQYVHFCTVADYGQVAMGDKIGDFEWGWHTYTAYTWLTHAK